MRYMRVKQDFSYPDKEVKRGAVLAVEDEVSSNGLVFILDGEFKYRSVHIDHLEEMDVQELHQELLQKRDEVTVLMEHKAKLSKRICGAEISYQRVRERLLRANASLNRMAMELYIEREEKALLLQQIERTLDERPKPIQLPHEVTAAIDLCIEGGMSRISIIANLDHIGKLFRDYNKPILDALTVIRDFARQTVGGGQDLLEALANWRIVEPTRGEQFDKGVREICERWAVEQESSPVDLAVRVVKMARSVWDK